MKRFLALLALLLVAPLLTAPAAEPGPDYDLVVCGGTASAVIAAVQAKKLGKSVVVVSPDRHLGGLSSGGLGYTDTGNKVVIGGLARDFYHRIWKEYRKPGAWRWQTQSEYGNLGQGTPAVDGENRTMWIFEPHVAERVFEDYVREFGIPVRRNEWLDRARGVQKRNGRLTSVRMLSGRRYSGRMFLDATYEGDLLAAAGMRCHVGREANSVYCEQWNGVQVGVLHHRHHFGVLGAKISPYLIAGNPRSMAAANQVIAFKSAPIRQPDPIATRCVRCTSGRLPLLVQPPDGPSRLTPGVRRRFGDPAPPPPLLLVAQNPPGPACRPAHQPRSRASTRACAGSGFSTQRLARCQRTPSRCTASRIVSSDTRVGVIA